MNDLHPQIARVPASGVCPCTVPGAPGGARIRAPQGPALTSTPGTTLLFAAAHQPDQLFTTSMQRLLTALLVTGVIALGAGALHRSDLRPVVPPLVASRFSRAEAVIRGAKAFTVSCVPLGSLMMSRQPGLAVLCAAAALFVGLCYGLVHKSTGISVRAALWEGWQGVISAVTVAQGIIVILTAVN